MSTKAKTIITSEYGAGSTNFVTPIILEYSMVHQDPDVAVEISRGEGFSRNTIYGVTFVRAWKDRTTERMIHWSSCCHSLDEVHELIQFIRDYVAYMTSIGEEVQHR